MRYKSKDDRMKGMQDYEKLLCYVYLNLLSSLKGKKYKSVELPQLSPSLFLWPISSEKPNPEINIKSTAQFLHPFQIQAVTLALLT